MNFVKSNIVEYASTKMNLELSTIGRTLSNLHDIETKMKEAEDLLQQAQHINSKELKDYTVSQLENDIAQYKKRLVEMKKLEKRKDELNEIFVAIPRLKK